MGETTANRLDDVSRSTDECLKNLNAAAARCGPGVLIVIRSCLLSVPEYEVANRTNEWRQKRREHSGT